MTDKARLQYGEGFANPTPGTALSMAFTFVRKDDALAYWNKAVDAFREALGDARPRGKQAN